MQEAAIAAQILDGRALAAERRTALQPRVQAAARRLGRPPGLGVVLVGEHGPSAIYVRNKARAAETLGMHSEICRLAEDVSQAQLHAAIAAFNAAPHIDAFLLQLPLPAHLDRLLALAQVLPHKDADGLHPQNVAALMAGEQAPRPCTPLGCMALIARTPLSLQGANAVVVGRSAIVGQPLAQMLLEAHATVTICHAQTRNLAEHVARAELLVVATGQPQLIEGPWVREGAVVLDVGISRGQRADGSTYLCGDVDFAAALPRAGYITPVPGGVGPMTIAMLLENAVCAAESAAQRTPVKAP